MKTNKKIRVLLMLLVVLFVAFAVIVNDYINSNDLLVEEYEDVDALATIEPTIEPIIEPTVEPTEEPTPEPTEEPTPTPEPTAEPTPEPENIDPFNEYYMNMSFDEKIELLREWFPEDKYWNTCGVDISGLTSDEALLVCTDTGCYHSVNGYGSCHTYIGLTYEYFPYGTNRQCLAFASFISDFLFGKDAEIEKVYTFDEIEVGDHIRITSLEHSVIVLEKTDDYITVVEVNKGYVNCAISWDRVITKSELNSMNYVVYSRIVDEDIDEYVDVDVEVTVEPTATQE